MIFHQTMQQSLSIFKLYFHLIIFVFKLTLFFLNRISLFDFLKQRTSSDVRIFVFFCPIQLQFKFLQNGQNIVCFPWIIFPEESEILPWPSNIQYSRTRFSTSIVLEIRKEKLFPQPEQPETLPHRSTCLIMFSLASPKDVLNLVHKYQIDLNSK